MIGLDTGHLVYNYGTKLQAYAMQCILEKNGEHCEIIQWHKKGIKQLDGFMNILKRYIKIYKLYGTKFKYWPKVYSRYRELDNFNKKYHIQKYYGDFEKIKKYISKYDKVFCGSDQAWLPANVNQHWYTLEFCNDKIFKAAYAPSFGIDHIENEMKEKYINFLSRFDAISVREISGQKIIKDILQKDVPVVLDPTLIVEKKIWDDLKDEHTVKLPKERYIFCYLLGSTVEHREYIKKIAQKKNLKIVNLQYFFKYNDSDENFGDINLYKVSPQDFIYLIANSEYVITDSFHCTVFSIHYKKEFKVLKRFCSKDKMSTNTRIYSLLSQLGLENQIVEKYENINLDNIDYKNVYKKLETLKEESYKYLNSTLEGNKNV